MSKSILDTHFVEYWRALNAACERRNVAPCDQGMAQAFYTHGISAESGADACAEPEALFEHNMRDTVVESLGIVVGLHEAPTSGDLIDAADKIRRHPQFVESLRTIKAALVAGTVRILRV